MADNPLQGFFDLFGNLFGGKKTTTKEPELNADQKAQKAAVDLAVAQGPTAYTDAMRANLGFSPAGASPEPVKPTGMSAQGSQPYWADWAGVLGAGAPSGGDGAPTLEQVLGVYVPPPAPTTPETTPTPAPSSSPASSLSGAALNQAIGLGGPIKYRTLLSRNGRLQSVVR